MIKIGRLLQVVGVVVAGLGIGMVYGLHEPSGFRWLVLGLILYIAARLWGWLRGKD